MKVEVALSSDNIRRLREQIEQYNRSLPDRVDEFCSRLADIGVDAAKTSIAHDESGELRQSISWRREGNGEYLVIADCDYAVYVEFGTGVVGASASYPGERPEGISTPNGDKTEWVYYDEKQKRYRITSGEVPQGYMWKGALSMRQAINRIAREVFSFDRH